MKTTYRQRNRRRRAVNGYVTAVCVLLVSLWLATLCRGQCVGGVCLPPTGWRPAPLATPGARVVQVGAGIANAVCRVVNHGAGGASVGSGTLVAADDKSSFVLTCDHLFSKGVGRVEVNFTNHRVSPAELIGRDTAHDLALLKIAVKSIQPIRLGQGAVGATATCIGLGSDGRLRAVRGRVVGRSTPQGAKFPSVLVQGAVRSGDSGGPLINDQGDLVGVVWGVRGNVSYASFGQPVAQLLAQISQHNLRQETNKPLSSNPRKEQPLCPCNGDCVNSADLLALVRREELGAFAKRSEVAEMQSQLDQMSRPHAPSAQGTLPLSWTNLQVVLAALGIGGPLGLGVLMARILWRRGVSKLRGPGGPRAGGFPGLASKHTKRAKVCLEPAGEQASAS